MTFYYFLSGTHYFYLYLFLYTYLHPGTCLNFTHTLLGERKLETHGGPLFPFTPFLCLHRLLSLLAFPIYLPTHTPLYMPVYFSASSLFFRLRHFPYLLLLPCTAHTVWPSLSLLSVLCLSTPIYIYVCLFTFSLSLYDIPLSFILLFGFLCLDMAAFAMLDFLSLFCS